MPIEVCPAIISNHLMEDYTLVSVEKVEMSERFKNHLTEVKFKT